MAKIYFTGKTSFNLSAVQAVSVTSVCLSASVWVHDCVGTATRDGFAAQDSGGARGELYMLTGTLQVALYLLVE